MQGRISASWKAAKIIPLYMGKGGKVISGSYRPISLINVASKIMERLVVNSLTLHLESQGYFTSCQHGFRAGRSTTSNMLNCDFIIWQNLNGSMCCDVIYIDFMRAFDKVDHNLMCSKLKAAGVDGCYLKWFIDFLSDKWQYVEYGSAESSLIPVTSEIIQGSSAGPSLFNIYINDLVQVVKHCKLVLFAVDLKAVAEAASSESAALVQCNLDAIEGWSIENKLPISLPKCSVLHYGAKNAKKAYTLGGQPVASVNECMDLVGIVRSNSFIYSKHIYHIFAYNAHFEETYNS